MSIYKYRIYGVLYIQVTDLYLSMEYFLQQFECTSYIYIYIVKLENIFITEAIYYII